MEVLNSYILYFINLHLFPTHQQQIMEAMNTKTEICSLECAPSKTCDECRMGSSGLVILY